MDLSKQSQEAGDNSAQIIAQTINITNGITEERVREIYKEKFHEVVNAMTCEAREIAEKRVLKLEDYVVDKFKKIDDSFNAFADPSFQFVLRSAQRTAAMTDKEQDYELLSQLLASRVREKVSDRSRNLAISKGIDIVASLPEESLIGLTMVYAISYMDPNSNRFDERLKMYENIFVDLLGNSTLPVGTQWIEDLDLLQLIRISPSGITNFKKMKDYLPLKFGCVMVEGIEESDQKFIETFKKFAENSLPLNILVNHPLKSGYKIISVPTSEIDDIRIIYNEESEPKRVELNPVQKNILKDSLSIINKPVKENELMIDKLLSEWNKSNTLSSISQWWDSIPTYFQITRAGMAVANACIRQKFPEFPISF